TKSDDAAKEKEPDVPDYCLVRFYDVYVRPGDIYEYRVRIRVANPNANDKKKDLLAYEAFGKQRELVGPWSWDDGQPENKRIIVTVAEEAYFYFMDRSPEIVSRSVSATRDTTVVQVHRWVEGIRTQSKDSATAPLPVGDWSVFEFPAHRAEYIGHADQEVEV